MSQDVDSRSALVRFFDSFCADQPHALWSAASKSKRSGAVKRGINPRCALATVIMLAISGLAGPSLAQAQNDKPNPEAAAKRKEAMREYVMNRFAPMWIPVPRFPVDPKAQEALPVPSPIYHVIWQPQWQKELDLSPEQKQALLAIHAKALADSREHAAQFKNLSSEERLAKQKTWEGGQDPWWPQFNSAFRKQIEAVLTVPQLQTIKNHTFPEHVVGLLYDAKVRREIAFGPAQEDRLRSVVQERFARIQAVSLKRAEKVWGLLTPEQKADLPAVVKRQGPTSAILSLASEIGFGQDNVIASYPMLAESPVRERLQLSTEQAQQLQVVMTNAGARLKQAMLQGESPHRDAESDDKKQVDAILTPAQLTMLDEIDFRRKVVLALGYPEKRESIGMTDAQQADLQRLDNETHVEHYRIDREMLGNALELLTPPQREQLNADVDRRNGG
jgi:hypothetical protein